MSKNPSVLLLEHHLKELKLPTFLRDYDSVGTVCSQERCDYPTYLLRLAERELIDRERRATERRIKEANFPVLKTIETFDFAAQVSINEPLVRELLRGEYISKRENLLLVGNPGTGKTHLATALGFAACTQGKRVRFMTTTGLVTQLTPPEIAGRKAGFPAEESGEMAGVGVADIQGNFNHTPFRFTEQAPGFVHPQGQQVA